MLHHTFKIIAFLGGIFVYSLALAADGVDKSAIDKSASPLTSVKMSRPSLKRITKWDMIDSIFPDSKQKYSVTIDLKDSDSLSLFNFNQFLCHLAKKEKILPRIAVLRVKNGTSFRFNKIKEGLSSLIQLNPSMGLEYVHTGVQTPTTPRKTLESLASSRGCSLLNPVSGNFVLLPQITDKEEIDSMISKNLFQGIQDFERAKRLKSFEEAFTGVEYRNGLGDWPPFSITNQDQIVEIPGGDLATFRFTTRTDPIFIIISGMLRFYDKDLSHLCNTYPSIKAVKFVDSAMSLTDLDQILPFVGTQLMMVDVAGAFEGLENNNVLPAVLGYLKGKQKEELIKYFSFGEFSTNQTSYQKLMNTINEYVTFLKYGDDE